MNFKSLSKKYVANIQMKHSFEIKQGCLSEKRTTQMLMIHLPFGEAFNVAAGQIAQMEEETLF